MHLTDTDLIQHASKQLLCWDCSKFKSENRLPSHWNFFPIFKRIKIFRQSSFVCLSVCLIVSILSVYVCLPIHHSVHPSSSSSMFIIPLCHLFCMSVHPPIFNMSVCSSICLYICLFVHLSVCPSFCLSIFLSVHPSSFLLCSSFVCLSVCQYVSMSVGLLNFYLSVHFPSVCLSICLFFHLSLCPSVCLKKPQWWLFTQMLRFH